APDGSGWPIYVLALGAKLGLESIVFVGRVWTCLGERPRAVRSELLMAHRVDLLLSPIGLLVAFAAAGQPDALLLVLPLARLFTIFAGERSARVEQTLELSGAY